MIDAAPRRNKVFISYSHKDAWALQRLQTHLKPLERESVLEPWDDTRIRTGQRWREEIKKALASAKVAILLISADFLASDFIDKEELPPLLAAEEKEGLVVMPVILGYCRFDRTHSLSQFQAVNTPSRPLNSLSEAERDAVWDRLALEIEAVLSSRNVESPSQPKIEVKHTKEQTDSGDMQNSTGVVGIPTGGSASKAEDIAVSVIRKDKPSRLFGSDLRPVIDAWVGREEELLMLDYAKSKIAVVTGIGGQGKSALVAKFLENWIGKNPSGFWDWRDCREEGDVFHTQLIGLIEHLTGGELTGDYFRGAGTTEVVQYFFRIAGEMEGVVILDNVDSYVNVQEDKFSLGVDIFVEESLRVRHNLTIILTCRPRVLYPSTRFIDIPLKGIELTEAVELFRMKGFKIDESSQKDITEIWSLTAGHPLWLNLIAMQMLKNKRNAPLILQELRKGQVDDRTRAIFRALWKGLSNKQKNILRCMAEVHYPETQNYIKNFVGSLIRSRSHFEREFEDLKSLSLVVERGLANEGKKFDLHPLVRSFIRTEYPSEQDRLPYIRPILIYITRIVTGMTAPSENSRLEDLQRWTAKAELELASHDSGSALKTISLAADRLIAKGYHEEFFRVAKLLLKEIDWQSIQVQDSPAFHDVVSHVISALVEHQREGEARHYLNRYENIGNGRTVARLRYCKVASYLEWVLGNHARAIELGREGTNLIEESDIDTEHNPSNTLALALRDSGQINEALKIFAPDQTIEDILLEDYKASGKDATFYGNVGRCLYLRGELELALHCFVNSAELLKANLDSTSVLNQGYAALWIGESLESMGDYNASYNFYSQSINIWSKRAPIRMSIPMQKREKIQPQVDSQNIKYSAEDVHLFCNAWIAKYRQQLSTKKVL
jgi:tetratricopeptide (TPR) repeat protein